MKIVEIGPFQTLCIEKICSTAYGHDVAGYGFYQSTAGYLFITCRVSGVFFNSGRDLSGILAWYFNCWRPKFTVSVLL